MTSDKFDKLAKDTFESFREGMSEFHLDKPEAWQFLIQLNTDLPVGDKEKYSLPLDMYKMIDSTDKMKAIILWRLFDASVPVNMIASASRTMDEYTEKLTK